MNERAPADWNAGELDPSFSSPNPTPVRVQPALELFLWVLAAVGVVLLVVHLYGALARFRAGAGRSSRQESAPGTAAPAEASRREPAGMEEIEGLARSGAFAEAIHLLLLRCFEHLRRQIPDAGRRELTSREFLGRATLPAALRDRLAYIVAAVEVGHFGGKPVGIDTYRRCLEDYRHIAASETS